MMRLLTEDEINHILDFIQPQEGIPIDTAMSVVKSIKDRLKKQLCKQLVYPEIIPSLKDDIIKNYWDTKIQPGESVGVICAQSIGEKQTQTTLNSVEWNENLLYEINGNTIVEPIGQMIDWMFENNNKGIHYIPENRTEYMKMPDGFKVPSCDEEGNMNWYKIEAITRHLPVGDLVKVRTRTGREVTATQSKSFLVWNNDKFVATQGCDIKIGDIVPVTKQIGRSYIITEFDLRNIFSPQYYIYTDEIIKSRKCPRSLWREQNGSIFTLPYNCKDNCFGKHKEYFMSCEPGLIYIHKANGFNSHIPSKIKLDNNFGFFMGIYLTKGWTTNTFIGISNNDENIRHRVTDYCDRYGVTYHLITSQGKNVNQDTSNDLKIDSVLMTRMLKQLCCTGSDKKIPQFVYGAPDEFLCGLIDGCFSGDGLVSLKDGSIMVTSASQDLLIGISTLLSYFGVYCHLRYRQIDKNNVMNQNIKKTYSIRISNGFAQIFANIFKLTEQTKQDRLEIVTLKKKYRYMFGKSQEFFPERNVYFDKVTSVEYVTSEYRFVYDLTVETTRNFQMWNGLNIRDTFHKAGQSEKTMTAGVPRFKELIDGSKNPKIVNHKIYFKEGNSTIEEIRDTVGHTIAGLTLKDISKSIVIQMDKEDEKWYDAHKILFNDQFSNHKHCITFNLNMKKLYEFKLNLQQIAEYIHKEYSDLYCVFSPPSEGRLDIFVDTNNIVLPENRLLFINQENAVMIYMEEVVQNTLEQKYICGIPAITEIFYLQEGKEWVIETNGFNSKNISKQYSSYKKLLAHPIIDYTKTISSNVWDIYEVFDIEAARQFLIEEFMSIMDGINKCHTTLLVDRMTHGGSISSITRYTLKTDECGPMGKASFEETMDNFLNAASQGQYEPTRGVSASIICGKRTNVGTGMISTAIDINMLPVIKQNKIDYKKKTNTIVENDDSEDDELPSFVEI